MKNIIGNCAAALGLSLGLALTGMASGIVLAYESVPAAVENPADTVGGTSTIDADFTKHMNIFWDDNDLLADAMTAGENMNLATAGLVMSRNAEISADSVDAFLVDLGFSGIENSYYRYTTTKENAVTQPARTFGHKVIEKDGVQYHVVCAVIKGTTTMEDVKTDIKSVKDGFYNAGKHCEESLDKYVRGISGATKENTILFITGHSLGASSANVAGLLCDDLVQDSHKFVYTFASPNYQTNPEGVTKKASYDNFHYYTNTEDEVPKVPLNVKPTYFSKVGQEHVYRLADMNRIQRAKFDRVYEYMRDKSFVSDLILLDPALANHLAHTYMSFMLSELPDNEIDNYLQGLAESDLSVVSPVKVELGKSAVLTATATGSITFEAADPKIASVSGEKLTANKPGNTVVYVTAAGTSKHKCGAKTIKVTVTKKKNTLSVKGRTVTVKKGKKTTIKRDKALSVSKAKGKVTYKKTSGSKKITINSKTGKVTVKKGLKKGSYKLKVKITAAGDSTYAAGTATAAVVIKVK